MNRVRLSNKFGTKEPTTALLDILKYLPLNAFHLTHPLSLTPSVCCSIIILSEYWKVVQRPMNPK